MLAESRRRRPVPQPLAVDGERVRHLDQVRSGRVRQRLEQAERVGLLVLGDGGDVVDRRGGHACRGEPLEPGLDVLLGEPLGEEPDELVTPRDPLRIGREALVLGRPSAPRSALKRRSLGVATMSSPSRTSKAW